MRTIVLVVAMALGASSARAEPTIARARWFNGGDARSKLEVRDEAEGRRVLWTLSVTTSSEFEREVVVPLTVMSGAMIAAMSVTIADEKLDAVTLDSDEAREKYEAIVPTRADPALLEFEATRRERSELTLRVFPISKTSPAKVTIELWIANEEHLGLPNIGAVTCSRSLVAVPADADVRIARARQARSIRAMQHPVMPSVPPSPYERALVATKP